jgi:HSP20 family protein
MAVINQILKRRFTMSNLTRWEPVREMMTLREAMSRLFDDAFTRPVGISGASLLPAIDLYETDDEVVLKANLPGFKPEDVHISVTSDMPTIRGELEQEKKEDEATYHLLERRSGVFERTITLPSEVKTDKAQADFDAGILTITMPKAESVKPRTITIKAK